MKVEPESQSTNKVDMSLDDIIKLDKQQSRINRMTSNRARGRRRVRVAATGIRLRSLRQRRISGPVGQVQRSRPLPLSGQRIQRFSGNRVPRNNRLVALAVLRRARQTAAAAARTAADAAALLQRSRTQRQRLFDDKRGIHNITTSAPQIPQRRRGRGTINRSGFRSAKGTYRPNALRNRIGTRRANLMRNRRQRNTNSQALRRQRSTNRNSTAFPAFINVTSNNGYQAPRVSNASGQRGNRGNSNFSIRGRRRGAYNFSERIPSNRNPRFSRNSRFSRDAEYLAQARALIRAQNEVNQSYNSVPNSRSGRWNSSRRGLNYYAQYWDN